MIYFSLVKLITDRIFPIVSLIIRLPSSNAAIIFTSELVSDKKLISINTKNIKVNCQFNISEKMAAAKTLFNLIFTKIIDIKKYIKILNFTKRSLLIKIQFYLYNRDNMKLL
jgi:hypothetical protein